MVAKKQPTQIDVANRAKVSRCTVSLVINGRDEGRISEETRQRVLQAVHDLGYGPNVAARMLVQQSNRLIGIFTYDGAFPSINRNNFFYPFVVGIEEQACVEDYDLLLFTRNSGKPSPSIYRDNGNLLGVVDGAVLMGSNPNHDEIQKLVRAGKPFVFIGRREIPDCDFDWVASDYKAAGFDVVNHLIQLGHRRIGYANRKPPRQTHELDRIAGCVEAINLQNDASFKLLPSDLLDDGEQLVKTLDAIGLTAIVCRDHHAMKVVWDQLEKEGRQIPSDISLVSLTDDPESFKWDIVPASISLNRNQVGREAVKLLVSRLKGLHKDPKHVFVPCEFNPGQSIREVDSVNSTTNVQEHRGA